MKVAILLSGRINNNNNTYSNIINSISNVSPNDIDFFISYQKNTKKGIVDNVTTMYKPKKIIENNEECFPVSHYKKAPETTSISVMCMYLSRLHLRDIFNEYVKTTNTKYDFVISSRMDIWLDGKLNSDTLLSHIKNNELCIPNPKFDYSGMNDQYAVGNLKTITQYLSVYDSLRDILDSGVLLHPETLLLEYLNRIAMPIHRFEMEYHIKRRF